MTSIDARTRLADLLEEVDEAEEVLALLGIYVDPDEEGDTTLGELCKLHELELGALVAQLTGETELLDWGSAFD